MQPLYFLVDCHKYFSAMGRVWRFLNMGKLFGTDGIRGIVGETLTAAEAFRVGQAIAVVLKEETGRRPVVTLGKDTRVSPDMLESALMAGPLRSGCGCDAPWYHSHACRGLSHRAAGGGCRHCHLRLPQSL